MTLPIVKAKLLDGRRGLIVGIANDHSIDWGCARAFRALGAELAITYLNEKARPHVAPLAAEVEAPIFLPMDVMQDGQLEAVFERDGRRVVYVAGRRPEPREVVLGPSNADFVVIEKGLARGERVLLRDPGLGSADQGVGAAP